MLAKFESVKYDKSIFKHLGKWAVRIIDGDDITCFLLGSLEEAQDLSDVLKRDYGEPYNWDIVWDFIRRNREDLDAVA